MYFALWHWQIFFWNYYYFFLFFYWETKRYSWIGESVVLKLFFCKRNFCISGLQGKNKLLETCEIEPLWKVNSKAGDREVCVCAPLERFTPSMPCRRALFSALSWRWAPLSIGLHEGGAGQLVDGDSCVTDSPHFQCVWGVG